MQKNQRQDLYTRITETIISSLEQGVRPWIHGTQNMLQVGSHGPYVTTTSPIPALIY